MVHKTLQKTKYCNNSLTELLCPGIVSSSCSTSGTPCAHNVKNLIISFGLYYKIRIVFLEKFGNLSKVKVINIKKGNKLKGPFLYMKILLYNYLGPFFYMKILLYNYFFLF